MYNEVGIVKARESQLLIAMTLPQLITEIVGIHVYRILTSHETHPDPLSIAADATEMIRVPDYDFSTIRRGSIMQLATR